MVESSYSILDGDQCCINVGYVWTIRIIHFTLGLDKVKRVWDCGGDTPSPGTATLRAVVSLDQLRHGCTSGGERGIHNCWQISIDISLCSHGIHGSYLTMGSH